jgi:hypothetical protein
MVISMSTVTFNIFSSICVVIIKQVDIFIIIWSNDFCQIKIVTLLYNKLLLPSTTLFFLVDHVFNIKSTKLKIDP